LCGVLLLLLLLEYLRVSRVGGRRVVGVMSIGGSRGVTSLLIRMGGGMSTLITTNIHTKSLLLLVITLVRMAQWRLCRCRLEMVDVCLLLRLV